MFSKRLLIGLVVALCLATVEAWDVHNDDDCYVATHCHACLLKLATTGLPRLPFSPPPVVVLARLPEAAPVLASSEAMPLHLPTRGPPLG
jgi:hypothetical protein